MPTSTVTDPELDQDEAIRRIWGGNLSEQMALHRLTNKALASRLKAVGVEVSPQAVGQWRAGVSAPRPHVMVALATVLRVSPRVLFSLDVIRVAATKVEAA